MAIWWDFTGISWGFHWDLMGFHWDLMGFDDYFKYDDLWDFIEIDGISLEFIGFFMVINRDWTNNIGYEREIPSGKLRVCYGKWPKIFRWFTMIYLLEMAIFHQVYYTSYAYMDYMDINGHKNFIGHRWKIIYWMFAIFFWYFWAIRVQSHRIHVWNIYLHWDYFKLL